VRVWRMDALLSFIRDVGIYESNYNAIESGRTSMFR